MLVSYQWLKDYVPLAMSPQELTDRLMMVGLNHESTEKAGDDFTIDLEVTSNRPNCLGHIGVAREISVVFDLPLTIKDPQPKQGKTPTSELVSVTIESRDICPRYVARVIRGVKIGPSPKWMQDRLATIGIAAINNVVDISNYVMMEIGQPLHTFDYAKIGGKKIVVRRAKAGEQFMAIDHKTYELDPNVCVIADANHPVALGGVMGGADSEVSDSTKDVLVEAAEFDPLSIRATARKLVLQSPSSYRFERMVDSEMVDWASRRCCELILELAGGELATGVVDVGVKRESFKPITLRLSQIERVLGIQVPPDSVERILTALGNEKLARDSATIQVQPPSWRRDLEREIDLVEEVARIHGYDKIPEDVGVRMAASYRRNEERRDATVRGVLTAAGYDEALTASVVSDEWVQAFSPWNDETAIATNSPLLRGADRLRKSLVPSLLNARRENEALSNPNIELFETAKVYLPQKGQLPIEWWMLGMTSAAGFEEVKGVVETLAVSLNPKLTLSAEPAQQKFLDASASCKLLLEGETVGYLGTVSKSGLKQFGLRSPTTIAELRLDLLGRHGDFVRRTEELSPFPAIEQDLNFIVDEAVRWAELESTVKSAGGQLLEAVRYRETYRNEKVDGPNKKRLLFSIQLRSREATLTSEQAEAVRTAIIDACSKKLGAKLLG